MTPAEYFIRKKKEVISFAFCASQRVGRKVTEYDLLAMGFDKAINHEGDITYRFGDFVLYLNDDFVFEFAFCDTDGERTHVVQFYEMDNLLCFAKITFDITLFPPAFVMPKVFQDNKAQILKQCKKVAKKRQIVNDRKQGSPKRDNILAAFIGGVPSYSRTSAKAVARVERSKPTPQKPKPKTAKFSF